VAVGFGSVWVAVGNRLLRFEPQLLTSQGAIPLGSGAAGVAVGSHGVWVTGGRAGLVWRIDPETNTIAKEIALGGTTSGIAVWGDSVWVAVAE
jgi:DNA-binding beta-propeller fold protein YncE